MLTKEILQAPPPLKRNKLIITKNTNNQLSAYINVKCSLQEIVNIFCVTDIKMFNISMKELYGKKFISLKSKIIKQNILLKEVSFITGKWKYIKMWNYIDNGVLITMKSTDDSDVSINITYKVSIINNDFFIKKDTHFNIYFEGYWNSPNDKEHIHKIVKGLEVVPKIIISNRIILQQFIDISRCVIDNKYCTNCASRFKSYFGIFHESTIICHLCGYNVCRKCILKHKIYQIDNYENISVCRKCILRLDNCDYSSIDLNLNPYTRIIADPFEYNIGHNMYDFLIKESINNEYALQVIELIFKNKFILKDFDQRNKLLQELRSMLPLEQCIVANQYKREYAIDLDKNPILVPEREQERISVINKINIESILKNPLLMFICDAVNDQMKSLLAIIIIIEQKSSIAIASNNECVIKKYERSKSICQHIVMTEKPLLVNNPEADVKFGCIPSIDTFKSYFGVPLIIDNQVIGTFCILGLAPRIITQSEYCLMLKFSAIVSKIIVSFE